MSKKLSAVLLALFVLALSIPALATASKGLTQGGSLLKVGTELQIRSTNPVWTTSIGNKTCSVMTISVTIVKNNATEGIAAEGNGKSSTSTCFFKGTTPISITNLKLTSLTSTPAEVGTAKVELSFEEDLPGLTCKYSATAAPATYTAAGVIKFTEASLTASPAACGTERFDAAFTLTAGGASVTID